MSEDPTVIGFDPQDVAGWGEEAADADLAEAVPKPLEGVEYTGDLPTDAAAEIDAVAEGFRARQGRESERLELATNSDFWCCLCFATMAQRDAFLAQSGWSDLGLRYLDGREIARRSGIDLPPDPDWPKPHRDRSWDEFAMTVEENRALGEEEHHD